MSTLIGRYNALGYAIYDLDAGTLLLRKGNDKHNENKYIAPTDLNALDIVEIANLCQAVGEAMAKVSDATWDGLDYDDSGNAP